jgi:predicted transcriptional regulator
MAVVRKRGEEVRHFVLANVKQHPHDIAALTAKKFGISRQAVNKHIKHLVR